MANINTRLYDLVNLVILLVFAVDIRKGPYTEVVVDCTFNRITRVDKYGVST